MRHCQNLLLEGHSFVFHLFKLKYGRQCLYDNFVWTAKIETFWIIWILYAIKNYRVTFNIMDYLRILFILKIIKYNLLSIDIFLYL